MVQLFNQALVFRVFRGFLKGVLRAHMTGLGFRVMWGPKPEPLLLTCAQNVWLLAKSLMFGFWCVQDWGGGLKLVELKAWDLNKKAELYYLWNLESDAATKTLLERAGQSNLKGAV